MTYITVTEAKAHLLDIIRKADKNMQHFVISKNGKPKAIIMSVDEYEGWLETLDIMSDKKTMKSIERAKKDIEEGKCVAFEDVFKETGKKKKR